jgi:hypothetical protein
MVHLRRLWSSRFDRLDVHLQQVKRRSWESSPSNR